MASYYGRDSMYDTYDTYAPRSSSFLPIVGAIAVIGLFFIIIYFMRSSAVAGGITNAAVQAPTEVDGKSGTVIPASSIPSGGSDNGLQFWMYIKDWDYKFGTKKHVIDRTDPTNPNIVGPGISLHPTDNALDIDVSVFSSGSNTETSNTGSGEIQTITIENVPLQSWFSVSVTIFQRNLDVYLNGMLVKSVTLAGVPKPVNGNITIGANGGFSGSVCNVQSLPSAVTPAIASAFYAAGSSCSGTVSSSSSSSLSNLDLFGYTFVFGVKDSAGKDVTGLSSSDVSGFFGSSR
jgi:hypothetical protein